MTVCCDRSGGQLIERRERGFASFGGCSGSLAAREVITRRRACEPAEILRPVLFGLILAIAGCSSVGPFVWAKDIPAAAALPPESTPLRSGDTVSVVVKNQPELTAAELKVRADGTVTLPLVGQLRVQGMTPPEMAREIQQRIAVQIVNPEVTVSLVAKGPIAITVIGEVRTPGALAVQPEDGILLILAKGGGFTDFAKRDRIFVLRQQPKPVRIRFDFKELSQGDSSSTFRLQDGDTVVVE